MDDAQALYKVLRQSADAEAVAAIERLVKSGDDREPCRIHVLDFAARTGVNEERARKIAAHDPDSLSIREYFRQIFWGSGIDLPANVEQLIEEITLESIELPPGEKALISLHLPSAFVIVFDPVTHSTQFIDVKG